MPGGTDQTLRPFLWRAEKLYPDTEIVSRTHQGIERYTYSEFSDRTARLAHALDEAGVPDDARVATFCWNHNRHFETYFAIPTTGRQLHLINPLLPDEHIQFIVDDADDQVIFVDPSLVPKLEGAAAGAAEFDGVSQFVVIGDSVPETDLEPVTDYESFIEGYDTDYDWPTLSEDRPAGMCYTSGTTGKPKGVEYTHQMLWSHTMASQSPQGIPMSDSSSTHSIPRTPDSSPTSRSPIPTSSRAGRPEDEAIGEEAEGEEKRGQKPTPDAQNCFPRVARCAPPLRLNAAQACKATATIFCSPLSVGGPHHAGCGPAYALLLHPGLYRLRRARKLHPEPAALVFLRLDPNGPLHLVRQARRDGEAEAIPLVGARAPSRLLLELLKEVRQELLVDANARVFHLHVDAIVDGARRHCYPAFLSVLDGVLDQISEDLFQVLLVELGPRGGPREVHAEREALLLRVRPKVRRHPLHAVIEWHRREL